jgi:CheY-like chemotaxis protein
VESVAARKFANLMPFGCWWFLNNPSIVAVFTDLDMPRLDGFDLLARIRGSRDAHVRSLPVVVISGHDEQDARRLKLEQLWEGSRAHPSEPECDHRPESAFGACVQNSLNRIAASAPLQTTVRIVTAQPVDITRSPNGT